MRFLWVYTFLSVLSSLSAQNVLLCRMSPDEKSVQLKWYCQPLISPEGCLIYRREVNTANWEKLNVTAVTHKAYTISPAAKSRDKELTSYQNMAAEASNIKGLTLLACVLKSFKSDEFSKYLGIRFDDNNFTLGKQYEYKLVSAAPGPERVFAISKPFTAGHYQTEEPVKDIHYKAGKRKVAFVWKPETDRYFGTDIYRRVGDTGSFTKVTKDPILLSKTKSKNGVEEYGSEFFVDKSLSPGTRYYYQFVAIDFFGSQATPSSPLEVYVKDLEAPSAPDSIHKTQKGRVVYVKWRKRLKESDLAGYNIYRTTKNDSDYTRINRGLISLSDFSFQDTVPDFGSYMYKVSALDQDQNESFSNPYLLEIYDDEPPLKPKGLVISSDTGVFRLRWDKNAEPDLDGYILYRTINADNSDTYVKITPVPLKDNFYEERLPKNTKNKFLYKVVAIDRSMNRSSYSDVAVARMPDVVAPSAPFLRTIYANEKNQIHVEWLSNADPDLAGYEIFRKRATDSSSVFEKINSKPVPSTSFRYVDRSAEPGIQYAYYIEALDSLGNRSLPSNHIVFQIKIVSREEITIHKFEARYDKKKREVHLKWRLSDAPEWKGVVIYKQAKGETSFSPLSGLTEELTFKDREVSLNGQYIYELRAYNKMGDVFKSDKLEIRTE